jgi:hypothetical protein
MKTFHYKSRKGWDSNKLEYLLIYRTAPYHTDFSGTISDRSLIRKIIDQEVEIDFKKFKLEFSG